MNNMQGFDVISTMSVVRSDIPGGPAGLASPPEVPMPIRPACARRTSCPSSCSPSSNPRALAATPTSLESNSEPHRRHGHPPAAPARSRRTGRLASPFRACAGGPAPARLGRGRSMPWTSPLAASYGGMPVAGDRQVGPPLRPVVVLPARRRRPRLAGTGQGQPDSRDQRPHGPGRHPAAGPTGRGGRTTPPSDEAPLLMTWTSRVRGPRATSS